MDRKTHQRCLFRKIAISAVCFAALIALIGMAAADLPLPWSNPAADLVERSWKMAQLADSYSFSSDVVMTTTPLATPGNVGMQSTQQSASLKGRTDLAAKTMYITLNRLQNTAYEQTNGIQFKVENGQAYQRSSDQEAWQESNDISSTFAPGGNLLAFLMAAKNIRPMPAGEACPGLLPDGSNPPGATCYRFDLDGPAFAEYVSKQTQAQMTANGKLPPGITLGTSEIYKQMTGAGTLWLGTDRLPMALMMDVQFPPNERQEVVTSRITSSLTDYQFAAGSLAGLTWGLSTRLARIDRGPLWGVWLIALLLALLVLAKRSSKVYAALVVFLIVAMVFGPVVEQVKAGQYYDEINTEQAAQQASEDKQAQERQAKVASFQIPASANQSPLEIAQGERQIYLAQTAQAANATELEFGQLSPEELNAEQATISQYLEQISDPLKDTDKDGLPDAQEVLLGTDPQSKDTDIDGIDDYKETNGFVIGGKTWYGNPRQPDSNNDGQNDGQEWEKDTDGDGTPDLWTLDNDGDGVPDNLDTSVYTGSKVDFSYDKPLTFKAENSQPNRIMYLEIQARTADEKQLQYSSTVLKWPTRDVQGAVLDFDGKTFRDAYPGSMDPRDAYGNVRLVPGLRIVFKNPNLVPPKEVYSLYGAVVNNLEVGKPEKVMILPMAALDNSAGRRVAFYSKVPLLSSLNWGEPLIIQPMWMVMALVETCKEADWKHGKCDKPDQFNQMYPVHVYPMAAKLTGLALHENINVDFAVVYPDPNEFKNKPNRKPQDINKLDTLALLTDGLDRSFAVGRRDSQGKRDFTLETLRQRFDNTVNSSVPLNPDRYNLDNIFRVQPYKNFNHPDAASAALMVTETARLLKNTYSGFWSDTQPITPTLLFAQEARARVVDLDSYPGSGNVTWDGRKLTLNMTPVDQNCGGKPCKAVPELLSAYMSWASYSYDPINQRWQSLSPDSFVSYLPKIYSASDFDPDPEVGGGMLVYLNLLYRSMYHGAGGLIEIAGKPLEARADTDVQIVASIEWAKRISTGLMIFVLLTRGLTSTILFIKKILVDIKYAFDSTIGGVYRFLTTSTRLTQNLVSPSTVNSSRRLVAGHLISLLIAIAYVVLSIIYGEGDGGMRILIMSLGIISLIGAIYSVWVQCYHWVIALFYLGMIQGTMKSLSEFLRASVYAVIVLSIVMLILWVIFSFLFSGWGTVQQGLLTGFMLATLIVLSFMILMSAFFPPLGIMMLVLSFMKLFGVDFDPITGLIEFLSDAIYVASPVDGPDLKTVKSTLTLANPEMGVQVGNSLVLETQLRTTSQGTDPNPWQLWRFRDQWDIRDNKAGKTNLKNLTFKTKVGGSISDVDASSLGEQFAVWGTVRDYRLWEGNFRGYRYIAYLGQTDKNQSANGSYKLEMAGVNRSIPLYSNYSYAIPVMRCILTYICGIVQLDGKNGGPAIETGFDVFPKTVDEFIGWMWLTGDPGSVNESTTVLDGRYPFPLDADGDGLVAARRGGNDPDDTKWDTDSDGLSDYFEMNAGQMAGGGFFDPTRADSENDGLSDFMELRWGSNPRRADTDSDGLTDVQEVDGFDFYYYWKSAGDNKKIHVSTDPTNPDTDGDGILDPVEVRLHAQNPAQYPYNPTVWNINPMQMKVMINNPAYPSGYIPMGWNGSIEVKRSVVDVGAVMFKGNISTEMPQLSAGNNWDTDFNLVPGKGVTETRQVSGFNQFTGSRRIEINTQACSSLVNPLLYYPFNQSPYLYNQYDKRYTPAPQRGSNGLFFEQEPAPGTPGYSFGLGERNENWLLTTVGDHYNGPFTWAMWVKPMPLDGNFRNEQAALSLFSNNERVMTLSFKRNSSSDRPWDISVSISKPVNKGFEIPWGSGTGSNLVGWVHLAAVYNGQTLRFFVNGKPVYYENGVLPLSGDKLYLGADPTGMYGKNWVGLMDEVNYYDFAVPDELIYRLANPVFAGDPGAVCKGDLEAANKLTLWVDGDNPTTELNSLASGQYINAAGTLVVGGKASDPTSPVTKVDLQVDGGAWNTASGKEAWAYGWNTAGYPEGAHTLYSRATDSVNRQGSGSAVQVIIDRTAPSAEVLAMPATAGRQDNLWTLHLYGSVTDPKAGSAPGSGVASLAVKLEGANVPNGGYQMATLDPNGVNWAIDYRLPNDTQNHQAPDPSGTYTVRVRTADKSGNIKDNANARAESFTIQRPQAAFMLNGDSPMGQEITRTVTFSGVVTDTSKLPSGVRSAQLAYIPQETMYALNGATAILHLDDPIDTNFFADYSGYNNGAACWKSTCPAAQAAGVLDYAVEFNGNNQYLSIYPPLAPNKEAFSLSFWVYISQWYSSGQRLLAGQFNQVGDTDPGAWSLTIDDARHMTLHVRNSNRQEQTASIDYINNLPGHWLYVTVRLDQSIQLNVDDSWAKTNLNGSYRYPSQLPIRLGGAPGASGYQNWIDEVVAFPYTISDAQMNALRSWKEVKWLDASLGQRRNMTTPWTLALPGGLPDNFYVVAGRAKAGEAQRFTNYLHFQTLWSGMIDLNPPKVSFIDSQGYKICWATDLNLNAAGYQCGNKNASSARSRYYHQESEWYRNLTKDTTRLYQLNVSTDNNDRTTLRACDIYDHCATATRLPSPEAMQDVLLTSQVISPTQVTAGLAATPLTTYAYGRDGLKSLRVDLNGLPFDSTSWFSPGVTETRWTTSWTPAAEGRYDFVSWAEDFNAQAQTEAITQTIYVDLFPPSVVIDLRPITTTHLTGDGAVRLQGSAFDSARVMQVDVDLASGGAPGVTPDWRPTALTETAGGAVDWWLNWPLDSLPESARLADGQIYTVTARAYDAAWREVKISQPVIFDVVPPRPVELSVSYQAAGGGWLPLAPGQTVRSPLQPRLAIDWSAAADGSGVRQYYAGFLPAGAPLALASLTPYNATAARHDQASQEATAVYAYLVAVDNLGNLRWNLAGPFIVDAPGTPDYVSMNPVSGALPESPTDLKVGAYDQAWQEPDGLYRGWITPQETLLGVSRAAASRLNEFTARSKPQALAASWDANGLRLSWSGGNWDTDGDLLVFLDSLPNVGSSSGFNPYTNTLPVNLHLPGAYDFLLWIPDNQNAYLKAWDGQNWQTTHTLDAANFRFTPVLTASLTETYLPFGWLGIANPSSTPLNLLALATDTPDLELQRLEIWAALPAGNPLSMPALGGPSDNSLDSPEIQFTQSYHWASLSSGVLPVQNNLGDVDLRLAVSSDPEGAQSQWNQGGYTWAWDTAPTPNGFPLADGQMITYQATLTNTGSLAARNVELDLASLGVLVLIGGNGHAEVISLGDLQPGEGRQIQWRAMVQVANASPNATASLQATLKSGSYEVDHLTIQYLVDIDPPQEVDVLLPPGQQNNLPVGQLQSLPATLSSINLVQPALQQAAGRAPVYTQPGDIIVWVTASDAAGVQQISLDGLDATMSAFNAVCNLTEQGLNTWSCPLKAPTTAYFLLRAVATDTNGHTSSPGPWRMFIIDQAPPEVALNADDDQTLSANTLNSSLVITGTLSDDYQVQRYEICLSEPVAMDSMRVFLPVVLKSNSSPFNAAQAIAQTPRAAVTDTLQTCIQALVDPDNAPTGTWSYNLVIPPGLANHRQALTIAGYDAAGNRSTLLTREVYIDSLPPEITVTSQQLQITLSEFQQAPFAVLSGMLNDPSGNARLFAHLEGPNGWALENVATAYPNWSYIPQLDEEGIYQIVIQAIDGAGNSTWIGVFELVVK